MAQVVVAALELKATVESTVMLELKAQLTAELGAEAVSRSKTTLEVVEAKGRAAEVNSLIGIES